MATLGNINFCSCFNMLSLATLELRITEQWLI